MYLTKTKYIHAPWNYQMNLRVSLWFFFVLFYFHLGRICDLCFSQKWWKSFYSLDKNILFSYEIIRGIQQATSISFFPFVGNQCGNGRKTGARSEHRFLARSRILPQRINSREIGETCQQNWKFQPQNQNDFDFLITYENKTTPRTRLIILVF